MSSTHTYHQSQPCEMVLAPCWARGQLGFCKHWYLVSGHGFCRALVPAHSNLKPECVVRGLGTDPVLWFEWTGPWNIHIHIDIPYNICCHAPFSCFCFAAALYGGGDLNRDLVLNRENHHPPQTQSPKNCHLHAHQHQRLCQVWFSLGLDFFFFVFETAYL